MHLVLLSTLPVVLAAEPSAAVVLSRRTAVSPGDAAAVTAQVVKALEAAQVPLLDGPETTRRLARVRQKDATLCAGKPACLEELLKQLEVPWLVLVSVAQVAGDKSLGLELFEAASGTVVEVESLVLPSWKAASPELLDGFAQRVLARVVPPPEKPAENVEKKVEKTPEAKPDAPLVTTLTPPEPPPNPLPSEPPAKSHTASWVLGGTAVAALAAAGVLLAMGLSTARGLSAGSPQPDGTVRSDLTGSEAHAKASAAGVQLGLAGGAAAAALGLGTAAILTW
jgi:hypothetical protein